MKKVLLLALIFLLPVVSHAEGDPLTKIAKRFAKKIRKMPDPRVGVLNFNYYDGRMSSGSTIFSERLTTYLASHKGYRLIERNLIRKILEEQHLTAAGVVDSKQAKTIGKILGVDVIVTGTLNDLSRKKTELNARVLRTDTGEVIVAKRLVLNEFGQMRRGMRIAPIICRRVLI